LKLRTRILALFALLGVLPVLALGTFGYLRSKTAVESLLEEEAAAIGRRIVWDLSGRYALRAAELQLVAANVETERLYRARAEGLTESNSEAFATAHAYLSSVWEMVRPSYHWIELRDRVGTRLYFMGEREAVRQQLGMEEPKTRGTTPDMADRPSSGAVVELEFPVTVPPAGDTLGVVVAAVRPGALLADELLRTTFGRAGHTTVLDRAKGTVIHHASRRLLNQSVERLFSPNLWNVNRAVLRPDSGSFTYQENDSLRVASFFNVSSPPWTIVVSAAVDEFASPFARIRNVNLVVMLLLVAAMGTAFFLMTRRATLSLEHLTAAADEVARGELAPQIPGGGSDEVGRLSRAFGIMVDEVRKMLDRVEETRHMAVMGEFASRVSHEIRTPLTSIKLNLQELDRDVEQGRIPDDSAPAVQICLREVERLDRAVSSVLSMVRTHPPGMELCSLHRILAHATEAVGPQLGQDNAIVEHRFGAARDQVFGDSRDLEGVFVNLLVNAGEAMPGGGTVRIDTETRDTAASAPGLICIRVSDEGPGVPAEIRGKIFRPFVSTKEDGTGFGLAVARRTVEEHGGRIDLDPASEDGVGATFLVELPLAEEGTPTSEEERTHAQEEE
jgi:signal transduction histidine kinase